MERLDKIDIDNYDFTTQELPILALIKLYLNAADQPVEDIDRALDSKEGLMDLIENAKATVKIQRGYEEELKYMLAVFLQKADEVTIADRYWVALKPFLVYCRKELQRLGFPQELWAEDDIFRVVLLSDRCCIAHRNRGLNDHHGIGIGFQYQLYDSLHRRSIKEVLLAVVVGRSCDDNIVSIRISRRTIQRGGQIQFLLSQILFNVFILNR